MIMSNEDRRHALADQIASIVLADGLDALALRGLAARLGTSGRMLLYYFETKEALVMAALLRISERMALLLQPLEAAPPLPPGPLVASVLQGFAAAEFAPFLRIWADVVARGGRGEAPYAGLARVVVERWVAWTEARLLPEARGRGHAVAVALLATIDGLTLLEMASPGCTEGAAALLPELWRRLDDATPEAGGAFSLLQPARRTP